MRNLGNMMKQAQQMQAKMMEMQDKLETLEVEGLAGGGMVKAVLNGKGMARRIAIDPQLLNASEGEVLEDLLVAAINDAKNKIEAKMSEKMAELTGGLNLPPGFKLPF